MNRHICQVEHVTDPTGWPRECCLKKATSRLIFKSATLSRRDKYIYRLCDEHFDLLQKESEDSWGLSAGEKNSLTWTFRKGKV